MKKELRQELKKAEGNRLKYLALMHGGRAVKIFGLRGTLLADPDKDFFWLKTGINLLIHGFIYLICWAIFETEWLPALITYGIVHLALYLGGRATENLFEGKLYEMDSYFSGKCRCYYDTECEKRGIADGTILIEGVIIRNGSAETYIQEPPVALTLYCKETGQGDVRYSDRNMNPQPGDVDMKKYISSVEFNKKYGIIAKKGTELDCVNMFRPTIMVKMIEGKKNEKLGVVEIGNGYLQATTNGAVEPANTFIDIFGVKSLKSYFEDVDRYCKEMDEMGNTVYAEISQITSALALCR